MEIEIQCPLGAKCEEAKEGKVVRCAWYTQVRGKEPQSGKEIDEWGCAMGWLPVLLVENARTNRGQTAALESFRNEMVAQPNVLSLLGGAAEAGRLTVDLGEDDAEHQS